MQIWACVSQKGGSGKSTLAVNLAVEGTKRGRKVLIIDLDPQGNALHWGERRQESTPDVAAESLASLSRVIEAAKTEGYSLVVIDTAPNADLAALSAAKAADFVIIPCRPSQFDLEAIASTLELCEVARKPAMVVLNQAPNRSRVVAEAESAIRQKGAEVCEIVIRERVAFRHSTPNGNAASEFEPDGLAAKEINALYDATVLRTHMPIG